MRFFIFCCFFLLPTLVVSQTPAMVRQGDTLKVFPVGKDVEWKFLRGYHQQLSGEQSSILGKRWLVADTLFFRPMFSFTYGTYTAFVDEVRLPSLDVPIPSDYVQASVVSAYPSGDTVPENLLKMHLVFSRPMQEGNVYEYLALLDAESDTIPRALLPLEPALWNEDKTHLTLWLEPGRIKRDLASFQKLGPILQEGVRYTLEVSAGMKDENGVSMQQSFQHSFVVSKRDVHCPDPAKWQLRLPKVSTMLPLRLQFTEPLDWATLNAYLRVADEQGKTVSGAWEFTFSEQKGQFVPDQLWEKGRYILHIDSRLEDLAGNNVRRLFDREVNQAETYQVTDHLTFTIE